MKKTLKEIEKIKKHVVNGLGKQLIENKLLFFVQEKQNISERQMIEFKKGFYLEPFEIDVESGKIETSSLYLREALEDESFKKEVMRLAFL